MGTCFSWKHVRGEQLNTQNISLKYLHKTIYNLLVLLAQFLSAQLVFTKLFLIISDGLDIQAGALLTMLRETRAGLEGQHSVLEQSIRQTQR